MFNLIFYFNFLIYIYFVFIYLYFFKYFNLIFFLFKFFLRYSVNNLVLSATVSVHNTKSGNVSCEAIQDGYADSCTAGCVSGTLFQLDFDGIYRIDSIAIYDAGSSSKARVTPRGILAHKSADLRLGLTSLRKFNQSTYVHVSVLDQRFWRSVQLLFERVPKNFILCEVKIYGFPGKF